MADVKFWIEKTCSISESPKDWTKELNIIIWMVIKENTLDYIIVHEMCHMYLKNHSREFWGLVAYVFLIMR